MGFDSRNQYNEDERLLAVIHDSAGDLITGSGSLDLTIYREYDGYYYDFSDSTFKASGWTSSSTAMTELDATGNAGVYYYDWDASAVGTIGSQRDYIFRAELSTSIDSPLIGRLKLGGWIDQVNLGGMGTGGGRSKGITQQQINDIAEKVWGYELKNKETAENTLLKKSEFNALADFVLVKPNTELAEKIDALKSFITQENAQMASKSQIQSKTLQRAYSELLGHLGKIKPVDYSKQLALITNNINLVKGWIEKADKSEDIKGGLEQIKESLKLLDISLSEAKEIKNDILETRNHLSNEGTESREGLIEKINEIADKLIEVKNSQHKGLGETLLTMTSGKYEMLETFIEDIEIIKEMLSLINRKLDIGKE